MKRIFAVALGILTAIGGFLDIGDIVTNAVVGSRFGWSLALVVVPHCLSTSVRQSKAVAPLCADARINLLRSRLDHDIG